MPIHHDLWRVGQHPERLTGSQLGEKQLEDMIVEQPEILSSDWMLIARQAKTPFGGIVDLIAVAPDGSLVLIELKRGQTPRDVVAQSLDYASWVKELEIAEISALYAEFSDGGDLATAFQERFHAKLEEHEWNQSHQIVIVAAELDDSTERIAEYLNEAGVAINVLCFQVFEHGGDKLLSRAWLVDPSETPVAVPNPKLPWNGEYYVSYGAGRSWNDARRYGFICGGGGLFYSRTLEMLAPGDRIWVNIPGTGYVGVGRVTESRSSMTEFEVDTDEGRRRALDVIADAEEYRKRAGEADRAEYVVRVEWLDTKPESDAVSETGFFGNQNTVCRPTASKWQHTIEWLKTAFPRWNHDGKNSGAETAFDSRGAARQPQERDPLTGLPLIRSPRPITKDDVQSLDDTN